MKLYKRIEPVWVEVGCFIVYYDTCVLTWMFTTYVDLLSIFMADLFAKSLMARTLIVGLAQRWNPSCFQQMCFEHIQCGNHSINC